MSDDNAFAGSLFRTANYRPECAAKVEHRHSGIGYISPAQRHAGGDHAILASRHALYARARERNPVPVFSLAE